eukprot:353745-Chlamydomonas_euryale.AAC.2
MGPDYGATAACCKKSRAIINLVLFLNTFRQARVALADNNWLTRCLPRMKDEYDLAPAVMWTSRDFHLGLQPKRYRHNCAFPCPVKAPSIYLLQFKARRGAASGLSAS